jgi:AAHS family 4-hydroxybenzoate transporter-like MFS transporter
MKLEIDDLIDSRPLGGLQMYVMVLCALAVLFDGYDLQVMALTVPALSKAWGMAPASFSVALSASLLGMGLGAAFIGPLGDRYGRRTVLAATLAIVGVSSIASALAHNVTELAICRLFTGAALGASLANAPTSGQPHHAGVLQHGHRCTGGGAVRALRHQ